MNDQMQQPGMMPQTQMDPAQFEQLLQQYGLTLADVEAMFQNSSVFPEQMAAMGGQMSVADDLRNSPGPEMIAAGRYKVAAHPLSFLATGINRIRGEKGRADLTAKQESLIDLLRGARTTGGKMAAMERLGGMQSALPEPEDDGIPYYLRAR